MITKEQLKFIIPFISDINLNTYQPLLDSTFDKYAINTSERIRCFIAQVAHESGSFHYVKELASGEAYEGRTDLGNTEIGDGIKFKGRGLIQVTGRANYQVCSKFLFADDRLLLQPSLLEQPVNALNSACWFWNIKNLNFICDQDATYTHLYKDKPYNKFQWLTIRINGGLNGYADRLAFYERAKQVIV